MHRADAARAVDRPIELTATHDGRIVADVVAEWARRHGKPTPSQPAHHHRPVLWDRQSPPRKIPAHQARPNSGKARFCPRKSFKIKKD
jgi:hypothetical protein